MIWKCQMRSPVAAFSAIKLVPNYASAYQNRAVAHEALGNRGEAIRDYRAALRLDATLEDSKKGLSRLTAQR